MYALWDWNGTLLDDTQAALDTLNAMLRRRGVKEMDMAFYRDHFSFPARPFYERIGMPVSDAEWDALAREYHDVYSLQPKRLNPDAVAALDLMRAAGVKQAIISALRQDLLEADVRTYGVADYFERVCGTDNLDGASKLAGARKMIGLIPPGEPTIVIGDAFHDKEVADAIGVKCVLHGQGSHAARRLAAVAPTMPTVLEATRLALRILQGEA